MRVDGMATDPRPRSRQDTPFMVVVCGGMNV